jgi:hypothetical protein
MTQEKKGFKGIFGHDGLCEYTVVNVDVYYRIR